MWTFWLRRQKGKIFWKSAQEPVVPPEPSSTTGSSHNKPRHSPWRGADHVSTRKDTKDALDSASTETGTEAVTAELATFPPVSVLSTSPRSSKADADQGDRLCLWMWTGNIRWAKSTLSGGLRWAGSAASAAIASTAYLASMTMGLIRFNWLKKSKTVM